MVTTTTSSSPRTLDEYVVSVAVSLEEVDDSTSALVPPLLVGLPLLLLLVGGTTWVVTGRALAPSSASGARSSRSPVTAWTGGCRSRRRATRSTASP